MDGSQIINSTVAPTADIGPDAMVLNSQVGEYCMVGKDARFCYSQMGDFSYISIGTFVFSAEIGKYTSISWHVSVGPANHDPGRISSHSMLFAKRFNMVSDAYYNQYMGG